MAVVGSASERAEGREAMRGENGLRGYIREFVVLTDNAHDDENVVMQAPLLPGMYEQYATTTSTDLGARVVSVIPRQTPNSRTTWYVRVEYSTKYERIDNPFTEPPEIDWDSEPFEEPLPGMSNSSYDVNTPPPESGSLGSSQPPAMSAAQFAWGTQRGIVNSAGDPYNPPAIRHSSRPLVTFTRNQSTFSTAFKVKFENSVNKTQWNGLQARQAFCRSIKAQQLIWKSDTFNIPDKLYYRVAYTFALKAETWDLQLLDFGPFYLKWTGAGISGNETPQKIAFTVEGSSKERRLGLLDHSDPNKPGQKLADRQPPQFNRYPVYRELEYSELAINLNLALAEVRTRHRNYRPGS